MIMIIALTFGRRTGFSAIGTIANLTKIGAGVATANLLNALRRLALHQALQRCGGVLIGGRIELRLDGDRSDSLLMEIGPHLLDDLQIELGILELDVYGGHISVGGQLPDVQIVVADDLWKLGNQGALKNLQINGSGYGLQQNQTGFFHYVRIRH